jgi:hypothetical protein
LHAGTSRLAPYTRRLLRRRRAARDRGDGGARDCAFTIAARSSGAALQKLYALKPWAATALMRSARDIARGNMISMLIEIV